MSQEKEHKPPKVSAEESAEFRSALNEIPNQLHRPKPSNKQQQPTDQDNFGYPPGFSPNDQRQWLQSDDSLFWQRQELSRSQKNNLQAGALTISARCDLHNLTVPEADAAVASFIQSALAKKWRCVIIISGKGVNSKPILKNWLIAYLQHRTEVLALSTAIRQHGGSGAFYVLLKNTEKIK